MSRDDLDDLIPDVRDRAKLLRGLDEDYRRAQKDDSFRGRTHEHDGFVYRFDRYGDAGEYLRHRDDACFVTSYAATHPRDDFAESFEVKGTESSQAQLLLRATFPERAGDSGQLVITAPAIDNS